MDCVKPHGKKNEGHEDGGIIHVFRYKDTDLAPSLKILHLDRGIQGKGIAGAR